MPLKPRSDLALINGIAHILIRYNLIDREYVEKHTSGFAELERFLASYTPERVAADHGPKPGSDFQDSAPLWTRQSRLHRLDDGSESQHARHRDGQRDLQPGAADRTDRPSRRSAVFDHWPVQRDGLARGRLYFEHARVSQVRRSGQTARNLRRCSRVDEARLPTKRGLAYPDIVEAAVAKKIRALWIIATNPLVSYPNQGVLRHGLSNLDFLVVQDGYHPTPTTELADLVLPAAIWGEKEGTYTNSERRVSKVNKAVEPPGEARSDFDIFLASRRATRMPRSVVPWLDQARRRVQRMAAGLARTPVRLLWHQLRFADASTARVQWPLPEGAAPERSSRLYSDGVFQTPDGRAKLICAEWAPFPEQPGGEYPFILNTGRTVEHWHTRTKTARGADSGTSVSARVAGNESARCATPRVAQPRLGGRDLAARRARAASNCG